ncbi:MAG: hypothetical protein KatS3mg102_1640 [Planctomycetota bacterium]|nr:MAG: hypothetical protein KatS3mg102_1640 [Planctomycetota bacterium]
MRGVCRRGGGQGPAVLTIRQSLIELTGLAYATGEEWLAFWRERGQQFDFERERGQGDDGSTVVRRPKFFGSEIASSRVIFVVDVSGSMVMWDPDAEFTEEGWKSIHAPPERVRMNRLQKELKQVLEGLGPEVRFNLIAFSDALRRWNKALVPASPENIAAAKQWVERLRADGGTYTGTALREALEDPEVDTIYLLSDGAPMKYGEERLDARYREEILTETARRNRFRRVRIHCLGFDGEGIWPKAHGPRPPSLAKQKTGDFIRFMQQLARDNGGEYRSIP